MYVYLYKRLRQPLLPSHLPSLSSQNIGSRQQTEASAESDYIERQNSKDPDTGVFQ